MRCSAAELARLTGLPVRQVRGLLSSPSLRSPGFPDDGLAGRDDLVALQRLLLLRELGLPDDAALGPGALLAVLETVRDRLDRQVTAVRAGLSGVADPAVLLDGFSPEPVVDEALHELARAWARTWTAGDPVDSPAARVVADRHRALVGTALSESVAALIDGHAHGAAAYARDALAVRG